MFDNLVESTSHKGDVSRKGGFFAGTLAIYMLIITGIAVGSILWYDSNLQAENLELLTELEMPIQTAPEPEPEQPKEKPVTTEQQVDVRTELIASTDRPDIVPKEVVNIASKIPSVRTNVPTVIGSRNESAAGAPSGPIGPTGGGSGPPGPPVVAPAAPPPPPPPATPKPEPPKVVRRSGGVLNGQAISKPQPPYPANAKAVRAQGAVTVQVTINPDGQVVSAQAISGHPLLRAAAAQAARGWRFSPTRLSGQPVEVTGTIIFNFTLQ